MCRPAVQPPTAVSSCFVRNAPPTDSPSAPRSTCHMREQQRECLCVSKRRFTRATGLRSRALRRISIASTHLDPDQRGDLIAGRVTSLPTCQLFDRPINRRASLDHSRGPVERWNVPTQRHRGLLYVVEPEGARGGTRTRTPREWKGGLSPPCLPIPPPGPWRRTLAAARRAFRRRVWSAAPSRRGRRRRAPRGRRGDDRLAARPTGWR